MLSKEQCQDLIEVMDSIPANVPWYIVRFAYMLSALRRTGNNKTKTSKNIHMSLRCFRNNINSSSVYGFDVPKCLKWTNWDEVTEEEG